GFLRFCADMRGLSGSAKSDAVDRAIETCFLQSVTSQAIDTLSKGYRHRTCLAQALLHDPEVLVLDEPAPPIIVTPPFLDCGGRARNERRHRFRAAPPATYLPNRHPPKRWRLPPSPHPRAPRTPPHEPRSSPHAHILSFSPQIPPENRIALE
ncbi:MAG: ATP-binding cassette domain-containing protein, partial [Akkermansiaceae bacterium]|nr:ATP-binding cassette domain-containing protein [Akkermansiaceae bacterium]